MENFKKIITVFLVSILCLSTLVACGGDDNKKSGGNGGDSEQVYRFSSSSDSTGLNPILNTTEPDKGVHNFIFEALVTSVADEDSNAILKPAAAENWEVNDDGTIYT